MATHLCTSGCYPVCTQLRSRVLSEAGMREPALVCPHPERCPATTRHERPYTAVPVGIQCKHGRGHQGDHAGYAGFGAGDVFWADEPVSPAGGQSVRS